MTKLCEVGKKGVAKGLRNFIQVDIHRAFEVGLLGEGLRSFKVRRPKGEERNPEELVRERSDELTLRAEEVGTWKSCINVDHIAKRKVGFSFGGC